MFGASAGRERERDKQTISIEHYLQNSLPLAGVVPQRNCRKLFLNYKRFTWKIESNHYLRCRFNFNFNSPSNFHFVLTFNLATSEVDEKSSNFSRQKLRSKKLLAKNQLRSRSTSFQRVPLWRSLSLKIRTVSSSLRVLAFVFHVVCE